MATSASEVDFIVKQIKQQKDDTGSTTFYNEIIERLVSLKSEETTQDWQPAGEQREACRHNSLEFQKKNFLLSALEVNTLLDILENKPRVTSTSLWNLSSSRRTAVYKLFKVTRWLLKDEDMIFDPLHRSPMVTLDSHISVDGVCGLIKTKPVETAQPSVHQIRNLSVNYILSKLLTEKSSKALREIDNALSLLDMSTQDISDEGKISEVINNLSTYISNDQSAELFRSHESTGNTETEIFADTAKLEAINWMQDLIHYIIIGLYEKKQILEEPYSLMFEELIALVLQAVRTRNDKYQVKNSTIAFGRRFEMKLNDLQVRSEADLYICHQEIVKKLNNKFPFHPILFDNEASLIALVEVKSRDAVGNIIHSSGTTPGLNDKEVNSKMKAPSGSKSNTTEGQAEEKGGTKKKLQVKVPATKHVSFSGHTSESGNDEEGDDNDDAEEADQDVPDFDDIEDTRVGSPPNDNLRRMDQEEKHVLRYFLPQLLGELMCTFELPNPWSRREEYHGTYRLGIAVTGLLVQFVAVILHHENDDFPKRGNTISRRSPDRLMVDELLRTVVFVTRPLDILKKDDRRIIIKTLASAALLTTI